MDTPFVNTEGSSDDLAMESIWKLHQLIYRLEVRQKRLSALQRDQMEELHRQIEALRDQAKAIIEEHGMPYYMESIWTQMGWPIVGPDAHLLETLKSQSESVLKTLNEKHDDAVKNSGEIELLDSLLNKGKYYYRIGSNASVNNNSTAFALFDEIVNKPKVPTNRKIDALLEKAKLALFLMDMQPLESTLGALAPLVEKAGDWDRKNKFKVISAFQAIVIRDIPKAAGLFYDGIATFSSSDMCSYFEFMRYACITNLLSMKRKDIKKNIIDNAHVIAYFVEDPFMEKLILSLYNCEYLEFMTNLLHLEDILSDDRFFGPHSSIIIRELRIIAFVQYLAAYKSVSMSSMSKVFGVSVDVLDRDLSNFISLNKISAKIDFEGDFIETVQNESRTVSFQEVISKGDVLLTHIQKLVRLLD